MNNLIDFLNYRLIIFLDEKTTTDYWLFSGIQEKLTGIDGLKYMGSIVYLMIFFSAMAFFGFKTLQGMYQYFSASNNPQMKAQYKSDIFEPAKGLLLLSLGATIINILCQLIFGYNIGLSIF